MGFNEGSGLVAYIPIFTSIGLAVYVIWQSLQPKIGLVNPNIQKSAEKVVDSMNIEDIGENIAFCRCWRSQKIVVFAYDKNTAYDQEAQRMKKYTDTTACFGRRFFQWNSKNKPFPLCDGSHIAHNKKTGDNVGPMCLKRKTKA